MAIISFDKDALVDYMPAYGGNRESEDPCIVRMKFVPHSRAQHYSRVISHKVKASADPGKIPEISHEVQRKQFVESVESVSGYFIGSREVTDPGELYDTADGDLVIELLRAMESQQKLSEGQIKNSQPPSAGT